MVRRFEQLLGAHTPDMQDLLFDLENKYFRSDGGPGVLQSCLQDLGYQMLEAPRGDEGKMLQSTKLLSLSNRF